MTTLVTGTAVLAGIVVMAFVGVYAGRARLPMCVVLGLAGASGGSVAYLIAVVGLSLAGVL